MAQVGYIEKPGALISTFTWSGLRNGDRGEPIGNASGDMVDGDFGRGGKVVIEASRDGHIYDTMNDRRRFPVLVNAPWLRTIPVEAAYVRPRVYGGDEATSITVTAVFGKPGR
jgi:hypothetical protein